MRRWRTRWWYWYSIGLLALAQSTLARAEIDGAEVTNVTASFHPGPYTTVFVDPADPQRIALGTRDGRVVFSNDGGKRLSITRAILHRFFDPYVIRGGERAALSQRAQGGNEDGGGSLDPDAVKSAAQQARASSAPVVPRQEQRSLLLFLDHLRNGRPGGRWQMWMGLQDPWTEVQSLAMASGSDGGLAVASPGGVYITDNKKGFWVRTVGGPAPMPRQRDLIAFAVAINPLNPKHILASTDHGLLVSDDGGWNFNPHPDPAMSEVFITRFLWTKEVPNEVYAIAGDSILASENAGKTFDPTYSAASEITDLALSGNAGYVATKDGIHVLSSLGMSRAARGREFISVIPWKNETALAATRYELLVIDQSGQSRSVLTAIETDKFIGLGGNGDTAWVVSDRSILRLGDGVPRRRQRGYKPPRLRLSMAELERAVWQYTGIGEPDTHTYLHDRWYAKLMPNINVEIQNDLRSNDFRLRDATFPVRFRQTYGHSTGRIEWSVFATWDLRQIFMGDNNVVNPFLVIEDQIRSKRRAVLEQVRWHYREAANVAWQLRRPPEDPVTELLWRERLEELGSYLEFFSGKKLVENNEMEVR